MQYVPEEKETKLIKSTLNTMEHTTSHLLLLAGTALFLLSAATATAPVSAPAPAPSTANPVPAAPAPAPSSLPHFIIQGKVYCDTCRAGFETSATEYLEGAEVRLQCRHFQNDTVAHTAAGKTDDTGTYRLELDDDHQDEICEVLLVNSPLAGCSELKPGRDRARVLLSVDSGLHTNVRFANPLGFLKAEPLAVCGKVLQQYALAQDD